MNEVMPYWPQQHIPNYNIHPKLIQYLNGRQWSPAVRKSISCMWVTDQLWEAFAQALANDRRVLQLHSTAELLEDFDAVLPLEVRSIGPSVLAVLKSHQASDGDPGTDAAHLRRRADAEFALFVEFLECCAGSDLLSHEPAATLRCIDPSTEPWFIPAPQQIRFASAIRDVFLNPRCTADVRTAVIDSRMFDVFAEPPPLAARRYSLDDEVALKTVVAAFERYHDEVGSSRSSDSRSRMICSSMMAVVLNQLETVS
ncbi:hypothetical protein DFH06DRAFT_1391112 [Mycena polygramma]|nr:hypothetical protein DFH06DRAFT_1391112 [Mycena polygramma]